MEIIVDWRKLEQLGLAVMTNGPNAVGGRREDFSFLCVPLEKLSGNEVNEFSWYYIEL